MTSAPADRPAPEAMAVRMASSRMAIRSSTMRMPKTICRMRPLTFRSPKARTMMVVLEMETRAPANRLS